MVQNTKNKKEKIMLQKLVLPKDRYIFVLEILIQLKKEEEEKELESQLKDLKKKTKELEKSRIELVKKFTKEIDSLKISDLKSHRLSSVCNTEYSRLLDYQWPYYKNGVYYKSDISFLEKELKIVKMSCKEMITSDILENSGFENDILEKLYSAYMQKYNESLLEKKNNENKQKDNKKTRKAIVNNGQ